MDRFEDAVSHSRYGGTVFLDGKEVGQTFQCVHCGDHHLIVRGSGRIRGWCQRCNGFVCGPQCAACVPFERWLEQMEGTAQPSSVTVAARG